MKTHPNMRSHYSFIPHALVLFCCLALLIPQSADAQQAKVVRNDVKLELDNGRSTGALPAFAPTMDRMIQRAEESGCDQDSGDCSRIDRRVESPEGDQTLHSAALGGLKSFKIEAKAPANSFFMDEIGNIGFGTESPLGRFHVADVSGDKLMLLDQTGNLEISGLLVETSSVFRKANFAPVSGQEILRLLSGLPITTWNYKTDDAGIRHMGPTAQDFYAAFGLGADDEHIAPLDVNGVALAGVKALSETMQVQADRIAMLEAQNTELLQRLQALEALISERDQ